jgi:hypothetical protein
MLHVTKFDIHAKDLFEQMGWARMLINRALHGSNVWPRHVSGIFDMRFWTSKSPTTFGAFEDMLNNLEQFSFVSVER